MALIHLMSNQKIAESLLTYMPSEESQTRSRFRPISPVKALSSLLGGMSREQVSYNKLSNIHEIDLKRPGLPTRSSTQNVLTKQPKMPILTAGSGRTDQHGIKTTDSTDHESFSQLENTLGTFVVALHSRCGNVVGKVIRNRVNADELAVNELYNALRTLFHIP